jgi:hypothetical protein
MRKYMTNLTPIPVFSIFRRESAPRHIENLIALLRDGDQAREFSLAIHSPLDLLEELGGDIRKQLDPFLQSDRIAVLADSDCGALHGLYSERETGQGNAERRRTLRKSLSRQVAGFYAPLA